MESSEGKMVSGHEKELTQCVRVAVNIRPLITTELLLGCTDCITIVPGEPQVQIGTHAFTFDHVFGSSSSPNSAIYDSCVAPLVDSLFHGYNATVLAYGQTGSGKTYTMGTNYTGEANSGGIIPKVMETIFAKTEQLKDNTEFLIRVSFIEIFKEEVFDLLDQSLHSSLKSEGASLAKPAIPARVPIQIRETVNGGITLAGVTEAEVRSKEEMALYLARGSLSRATGSTNMNSQSSRSHAIFTISMEQKRSTSCLKALANSDEVGDDILCAKLHLVDLAGSERAKRTGADGLRFKEGIHINRGLLALGNVISALGDEKKRKEGGHVPYRDSKLTRLLQARILNLFTLLLPSTQTDQPLGLVLIVTLLAIDVEKIFIILFSGFFRGKQQNCDDCPADTNAEETLNTLKYANRARNIQNKAIINRDPMAAQMQRMRSQIEQLQAELLYFRGEGAAPFEELQVLRHKNSMLEASNAELHQALQERQNACEHLKQRAIDAQDFDLLKTYVSKIQELEGDLQRLRGLNGSKRNSLMDCFDLEDDGLRPKEAHLAGLYDFSPLGDDKAIEISGDAEVVEKELEHSSLQDKLDKELQELDKRLEQKEAEMKRFSKVDTSVLKQHYEKKLLELEQEKKVLLKEIEDLRCNLANISSTSDDGAQKLRDDYIQKLNFLESQVSELKRKQEAQSQLLRQKQKSDEASKRLQEEIQRIKTQKVQLQHKIKQESEQFRAWKALREKEVLQLKKEGRRNEYEMHKLLALNQRQKMVLQRKTEEASMATKRLKELLESRKASSRENSGIANGNGPGMQALMQAIEHEVEVMVRVHEVRSEYERQMEARAAMAKEVAKLKEESEMLKQKTMSNSPQTMSPGARNSRIFALENMLATSSSTLVSMASQLSEAEERERIFSGRGRWNQVRSLAEAKNLMNYLFNLLSSSRCQLRDKEVDCREKVSEIKDLKEKVVRLNSLVRQMEVQVAEMRQQEKIRRLASKNVLTGSPASQFSIIGDEKRPYDLRKGPRSSQVYSYVGNIGDLEDMDTSDSDRSDQDYAGYDDDDGDWVESGKLNVKKRGSKIGAQQAISSSQEDGRNPESLNSENLTNEEAINKNEKSASNICCSCSKYSSCKTGKCECRASSRTCGQTCGCRSSKCANREGSNMIKEVDSSSQTEISEGSGIGSSPDSVGTNDAENNRVLASHGAMLLQSALSEKPVELKDGDTQQRRPLSDIGNTVIKCNAPRPSQRKKWRKSEIQLVPAAPLASTQPESNEAPKPMDNVIEPDIPLKLPRAMNPTTVVSNPLRERNSHLSNESASEKEATANARRSPVRRAADLNEKENNRI
ncbi:kinesin-like protein KIN-4C isoform X2 [Magnolia sinica]|uniref:kinesin-like protein KIN-4C isoform X2 n=1 Tax=Magnolia sinica TaxID=86752 RepID=UPI00265B36AF|nr:kinesin-like protein KIN-4C isoform X2 [Magnolia sinica]